MKPRCLPSWCLAVLLATSTTSSSQDSGGIPRISYGDLTTGAYAAAKTSQGTIEGFYVTDLPLGYQTSLEQLISVGPECLLKPSKHSHHFPSTAMPDGSTRTTYATEDSSFPPCLSMMAKLTETFDQVESAVSAMLQEAYGPKELAYLVGSERVKMEDAPVKDHVHVYQKTENSTGGNGQPMVPYHTDNGLFLLLTPFPDPGNGLLVKLGSEGTEYQTSSGASGVNSLLVLMGRGLTEWLLQEGGYPASQTTFVPVRHAVPALTVEKRSVYARMKVAPGGAVPASLVRKEGSHRVKDLKTFHDVFIEREQAKESSRRVAFDSEQALCSVDLQQSVMTSKEDRVSLWYDAMDANCQKGEAYCWMSCMEVPQPCQPYDQHRSELQCKNPKNNVTCRLQKNDTGAMDPGCAWQCNNKPVPYKSDFCNGAMDMLMSGFEGAGEPSNPCVILFFEAWTLDTRVKFGFACVGVALLGFTVEAVIALRRKFSTQRRLSPFFRTPPSLKRLAAVFLFGLNLVLGYLAMLVAMTYSVELFLCVVLGLMAGHAFFNVKQPVGETIDPCCAASQNNDQEHLVEEGVDGGCPANGDPTVMGPVSRTPSCSGPCSSQRSTTSRASRPSILKSGPGAESGAGPSTHPPSYQQALSSTPPDTPPTTPRASNCCSSSSANPTA